MKHIAKIHTDFKEKFGIPRQSGIADGCIGRIVFEPEYRNPDAIRGIEGYSHLWVIWEFSEAVRDMRERGKTWSPTVRPPRLGGNKRMGVFATRSPYRPNPIGLSSVRLIEIEHTDTHGDVLVVSGADMLDGTPIYDIKPYLAFTDSHPDAVGGFADGVRDYKLDVVIARELSKKVDESKLPSLIRILEDDPRPSYKEDGEREYGMSFADYEVRFKVSGGVLTVTEIDVK
ncbi:MAG: tRNA (N6-threonylcarbamoyladenosine(37)-N6)-methyltransferase TrmO [Clostridia bacterium]|nr:tRNA (N6-threonylcarbamoyladenosine(37)-N6)-methyltransferase TrmO [Clostridia bacterium]